MLKSIFREMYLQEIRENGYEPTEEGRQLIDIAAEMAAEAFAQGQATPKIELQEGRHSND